MATHICARSSEDPVECASALTCRTAGRGTGLPGNDLAFAEAHSRPARSPCGRTCVPAHAHSALRPASRESTAPRCTCGRTRAGELVRHGLRRHPTRHLLSFAVGTGSWCSGLTCQPVTLETAGSNPVEPAIRAYPSPVPARTGLLSSGCTRHEAARGGHAARSREQERRANRCRLTHNQARQAPHQPASHRWGGTST